jgi:hypothetical protein
VVLAALLVTSGFGKNTTESHGMMNRLFPTSLGH